VPRPYRVPVRGAPRPFVREGDGFVVRDVGSLNGTYVNRDRIERASLKAGDEVLVVTPSAVRGQVEDRFRAVDRRGRLAGWNLEE